MGATIDNTLLVMLLGIISTTQLHLAKALERQGIETWDLLRARIQGTGETIEGQARKPLIYTVGLILNHTTFIYALLIAPLGGNVAVFTSMYGLGLVVLLLYATRAMQEPVTRRELAGAGAILAGTLVIGIENIFRPTLDMGTMDLARTVTAVTIMLGLAAMLMVAGLKNGAPNPIGLAFGLAAGASGSLDPFLKGAGQTAGGGAFAPGSLGGWLVLGASFLVGEGAVLITQWGFYRRARANILVPAYNCAYIGLPVLLQALLLPGYALYGTTVLGLGLIMAGFGLIQGFRPGAERALSG